MNKRSCCCFLSELTVYWWHKCSKCGGTLSSEVTFHEKAAKCFMIMLTQTQSMVFTFNSLKFNSCFSVTHWWSWWPVPKESASSYFDVTYEGSLVRRLRSKSFLAPWLVWLVSEITAPPRVTSRRVKTNISNTMHIFPSPVSLRGHLFYINLTENSLACISSRSAWRSSTSVWTRWVTVCQSPCPACCPAALC